MPYVFDVNEEAFVSYVEERSDFAKMCDLFVHVMGNRPEHKNLPETALIIKDGKGKSYNRYLILYGDHTEAYRKLVPDLTACLKYFNDNIHQIAPSSDTLETKLN